MKGRTEQAAAWIYQGVWAVLVRWFRVPAEPPSIPARGTVVEAFRPAPGFLKYLKFWFWIVLAAFDVAIIAAWIAVAVEWPIAGVLTAAPVLVIAVVPDIVAYVAIHLRYDTTWYVLTDRSMRIRRGIWTIHETTITYENVQNVTVQQGPVQRYFGIADVVVQTAGGGGMVHPHGQGATTPTHIGLLEGLADAERVRDLILARLQKSRTAGLGDERGPELRQGAGAWTAEHIAVLREIRDRARALAAG